MIAVLCFDTVRVTVSCDITHLCPYADEVDHGTVQITWTTDGETIELHSLTAWLQALATEKASHEEITACIRKHIESAAFRIIDVRVATRWETAGFRVEVGGAVPRERLVAEGA
jgi:NADPH-dependent 7-cyano-7-deazaguanine reductase QueF